MWGVGSVCGSTLRDAGRADQKLSLQAPALDSFPEARRPASHGRGMFLVRDVANLVEVAKPQPISLGIMPGSQTESD